MIGRQLHKVCGLKFTEYCCKHPPCLFMSAGQVYLRNCLLCLAAACQAEYNECMHGAMLINRLLIKLKIFNTKFCQTDNQLITNSHQTVFSKHVTKETTQAQR